MQLEARKDLHDIQLAADLLHGFISGRAFADYEADPMLRSAVERQFEIVGEALAQLAKIDPNAAAGISEHRRIIGFRNILIHGYRQIDDRLVWDIVESRLERLRREVAELIHE